MINIVSYAVPKGSGSGSGGSGGSVTNYNTFNGINPVYLWGNYFDGTQDISGNIDASKSSITAKNVYVTNDFEVNVAQILSAYTEYMQAEYADVLNDLSVSGNTEVNGTLDVGGNTTLGGNINVAGNASITGNTTVLGESVLSGGVETTDIQSENITNSQMIKTKDLEVTGRAHFFELVIDKIKAAGGAVLLTPADGFSIDKVEDVTNGKKLYFRSTDGSGRGITNMWQVGDQAICQSFNEAKVGVSYNVSNKYWWALVTDVSEQPVHTTISGETQDAHYITISTQEGTDGNGVPYFDGVVDCEVGDSVAMLGYRGTDDEARQSAIYISAYQSIDMGLTAPLFAEYKGIDDFDLASHRASYIDATGASFKGELRVENGDTVENYVSGQTTILRNEFKVDINGLESRVSRMSNPNILPSNEWRDQDDNYVFQENEEDYTLSGDTLETSYAAPPIMYLDEGDYTMSLYACAKYKPIAYGVSKDNLDQTLDVTTMINSGDTWHEEDRSQTTFHAPIDGYYHIEVKMMNKESYHGDVPYEPYEPVSPDNPPVDPEDPDAPTSGNTIQTHVYASLPTSEGGVIKGLDYVLYVVTSPADYSGNLRFVSSDPSIATVSNTGMVRGVGNGNATISVIIDDSFIGNKHYLGSEAQVPVTSIASTQANIEITDTVIKAASGVTSSIHYTITPSSYPASSKPIFTSSDPTHVAVNSSGAVTCINDDFNSATITVELPTVTHDGITYIGSSDSVVVVPVNQCVITYTTVNGELLDTTTLFHEDDIISHTYGTIVVKPKDIIGLDCVQADKNLATIDLSNTLYKDFALSKVWNGTAVFSHNSNLTSVVLPQSLMDIRHYEFRKTNIEEIVIPPNLTIIAERAFSETPLKSIEIPQSVTYIGEAAFYDTDLETVVIPSTVTGFGRYAFEDCDKLKKVELLANITSLPEKTFYRCTSLSAVTLSESIVEIYDDSFWSCGNIKELTLLSTTPPSIWMYEVEQYLSSDTYLYVPASAYYTYLENTIWNRFRVRPIGRLSVVYPTITFSLNGVTHLDIGETTQTSRSVSYPLLEDIEYEYLDELVEPEFTYQRGVDQYNVSSSTTLTIVSVDSNGVVTGIKRGQMETIEAYTQEQVISGVTYMESNHVSEALSGGVGSNIIRYTTTDGEMLTNLNALDSTEGIISHTYGRIEVIPKYQSGYRSLAEQPTLRTLDLTDCCYLNYGNYAYAFNPNLTDITFGNVESIGCIDENTNQYVCSHDVSLTGITIPSTVTELGSVFADCTGLTEFTLGPNIKRIGSQTFSECSGLTEFNFDDNLEFIGGLTFYQCYGLTNIDISNTKVERLYANAFCGCNNVTNFELNEGLTWIGSGVFDSCGMRGIILPSTVSIIDDSVFYNCQSLSSITCKGVLPPTITSNTFRGYSNYIYVHEDYVDTYKSAEYWSDYSRNHSNRIKSIEDSISLSLMNETFAYGIGDTVQLYYEAELGIKPDYNLSGTTVFTSSNPEVFSVNSSGLVTCNNYGEADITIRIPSLTVDGLNVREKEITRTFSCHHNVFYYTTTDGTMIDVPQAYSEYVISHTYGVLDMEASDSTTLNSDLFGYNTKLLTIDASNTYYDAFLLSFAGCTSLVSATLGDRVHGLSMVFEDCSSLTGFTFNDSTRIIYNGIFKNCSSLTDVEINENMENISVNEFNKCSRLNNLTVRAITPPQPYNWGDEINEINWFKDGRKPNIYVPAESVSAYKNATGWSNYARYISAIVE